MAGALEGLRMVEWSVLLAGTGAGYMMGDMGMEVIHIEDPVRGDTARGFLRMYDVDMAKEGRDIIFEHANRNKLGITVNLKHPKGLEAAYRLIAKSDVFMTNFHKDLAKRLKMDYNSLRKVNPRLIYCNATGYGTAGPWGKKRGFDPIGQARSGIMWASGDRDQDEPVQVSAAIMDTMGATMTAYGIMAALLGRERTGRGQEIETSILAGGIHLMGYGLNMQLWRGRSAPRHSRARARNPMANHYRCKDEKWMMLAEPQSDRYWQEFCEAMGLQDMEKDPRFDSPVHRRENYQECNARIAAAFMTKARDEWGELFERKGLEFAYSPIMALSDLEHDPQVLENQYIVDLDHPTWGKIKTVGFPVKFSETPCQIYREAPEWGQHTEQVLSELCGYSFDDIAQLRADGAV